MVVLYPTLSPTLSRPPSHPSINNHTHLNRITTLTPPMWLFTHIYIKCSEISTCYIIIFNHNTPYHACLAKCSENVWKLKFYLYFCAIPFSSFFLIYYFFRSIFCTARKIFIFVYIRSMCNKVVDIFSLKNF